MRGLRVNGNVIVLWRMLSEKGGGISLGKLPKAYDVKGYPTKNYARANDYANINTNKGILGMGDGSVGNIVAWASSQGSGHTGIIGCDGKIYSATEYNIAEWNKDFSWHQFWYCDLMGRKSL